jgi:hypothetical protein
VVVKSVRVVIVAVVVIVAEAVIVAESAEAADVVTHNIHDRQN